MSSDTPTPASGEMPADDMPCVMRLREIVETAAREASSPSFVAPGGMQAVSMPAWLAKRLLSELDARHRMLADARAEIVEAREILGCGAHAPLTAHAVTIRDQLSEARARAEQGEQERDRWRAWAEHQEWCRPCSEDPEEFRDHECRELKRLAHEASLPTPDTGRMTDE